ncbi:MAG: 4Fe-4S binding protein, partial [Atopobiaceae bacterium]|nr:4Fe-4S binding protein [Atopobiaceae bacterium]
MRRKIIQIDEDRCTGCGACAQACHEGAIGMVNGKARLLRDDYCDGLGDCLPTCPADAIHFVERDAAAYDAAAVREAKAAKREVVQPLACGCPGTRSREIRHGREERPTAAVAPTSQLSQWPVQIKLAPPTAP